MKDEISKFLDLKKVMAKDMRGLVQMYTLSLTSFCSFTSASISG
jgi:hypothetical protein